MGKALWTQLPNAKITPRPKGRKYLRGMSSSRRDKMKDYMKLRSVFLRGRPCAFPGCMRQAEDVHHSRGRAGKLFLAVEFFIGLCRRHHDWVGNNIEKARQLGLICERGKWNSAN